MLLYLYYSFESVMAIDLNIVYNWQKMMNLIWVVNSFLFEIFHNFITFNVKKCCSLFLIKIFCQLHSLNLWLLKTTAFNFFFKILTTNLSNLTELIKRTVYLFSEFTFSYYRRDFDGGRDVEVEEWWWSEGTGRGWKRRV